MPSPILETARLRMQPLALDHLVGILRIWNDAEVGKFLWDGRPVAKEQAEATVTASIHSFERLDIGLWAVVYREREELIGFCGLRYIDDTPEIEILYGLKTSYWGQGLATEAVQATLRYGFDEKRLGCIRAITHPANIGSWRVLEKVGMRLERRGRFHNEEAVFYTIRGETFQPDPTVYSLRRA